MEIENFKTFIFFILQFKLFLEVLNKLEKWYANCVAKIWVKINLKSIIKESNVHLVLYWINKFYKNAKYININISTKVNGIEKLTNYERLAISGLVLNNGSSVLINIVSKRKKKKKEKKKKKVFWNYYPFKN